jgi:hypothetical protein
MVNWRLIYGIVGNLNVAKQASDLARCSLGETPISRTVGCPHELNANGRLIGPSVNHDSPVVAATQGPAPGGTPEVPGV